MMGGYPGAVNRYQFIRSSDVLEKFSNSSLVNDIRELKGETVELGLRQQDFSQEANDVYAVLWSAAGGFGDPLERDPAKVEADIHNGDVSALAAREIYGVVHGDAKATGSEREKRRLARIVKAPSSQKIEGKVKVRATENLTIKGSRWCCAKCSTDLGSLKDNYKNGCVRNDLPIEACNPIAGDPKRFIDPLPQFRQFCCPGCGLAIENEIAIESDPLLKDVELR